MLSPARARWRARLRAGIVVAVLCGALAEGIAAGDDAAKSTSDCPPKATAPSTTVSASTTVASGATTTAATTTLLDSNVTLDTEAVGATTVAAAPGSSCIRLGGADRYATAMTEVRSEFEPGVSDVFLATGAAFPDGLAGSAAAGSNGSPVLLVDPKIGMTPDLLATLQWLQPIRIVLLGTTDVMPASVEQAARGVTNSVLRIGGSDRYDTAARVSAAMFDPGADVVYLATGVNWPDGLAAGAVAGHLHAPVLLVQSNSLPSVTSAELKRLAPKRIVIVGGTDVVSENVSKAAASVTGAPVTRLGGADRYATAQLISQDAYPDGSVPIVYLSTGQNFPDALAGGAAAATNGGPILLVKATLPLPAATAGEIARLRPARVVVLGTTDVVKDDVVAEAERLAAGTS